MNKISKSEIWQEEPEDPVSDFSTTESVSK